MLSEAFLTLRALVRFFPHVGFWWTLKWEPLLKFFSHCPQLWGSPQRGLTISAELEAVVESFPTDRTLIWLLPCVGPLGNSEASALVEAFPTFPTLVGSLPCVSSQVGGEAGALAEAFPTLTALGRFLSRFFGVKQDKNFN